MTKVDLLTTNIEWYTLKFYFPPFPDAEVNLIWVIGFLWFMIVILSSAYKIANSLYYRIVPKTVQKWLKFLFHLATNQRYTRQSCALRQLHKAQTLEKENRLAEALLYYDRSIELSSIPFALNRRGLLLLKIEKYDLAFKDFSKSSELQPKNGEYFYNIGRTLWKLGQEELALNEFEKGADLCDINCLAELQKEKKIIRSYVIDCFTDRSGNSQAIVKTKDNLYQRVIRSQRKIRLNELVKLQKDQFPIHKWFNDSEYKVKTMFYEKSKKAADEELQKKFRIYNVLKSYGVNYLYHLTHINDLPNILQKGLLSRNAARGFQTPAIRGVTADYIPLYFSCENIMRDVKKEIEADMVILGINTVVISEKNIFFNKANASTVEKKLINDSTRLADTHWSLVADYSVGAYKRGERVKAAEVWVYERLDPSDIQVIYAINNATLEKIKKLLSQFPGIKLSKLDQFDS